MSGLFKMDFAELELRFLSTLPFSSEELRNAEEADRNAERLVAWQTKKVEAEIAGMIERRETSSVRWCEIFDRLEETGGRFGR